MADQVNERLEKPAHGLADEFAAFAHGCPGLLEGMLLTAKASSAEGEALSRVRLAGMWSRSVSGAIFQIRGMVAVVTGDRPRR